MRKPLGERTRLLVVLLSVHFALASAWALSLPWFYRSLAALPQGQSFDTVPDNPTFIVIGILAWIAEPVGFLTLIVFLMWIHRATGNLRVFTDSRMRSTANWAVGWYFIPIACLFKPYESMMDIWLASHGDEPPQVWPVRLWWAAALATVFASIGQWGEEPLTVAQMLQALRVEAVGYVLTAVLAGLTLWIVARIGKAYARNVNEWTIGHPQVAADWYPDPAGGGGLRYWDGAQWSADVRAGSPLESGEPPVLEA